MTIVQCRSCQHVMSPDSEGRLPPWCPVCGSDLKPKAGAQAAQAAPRDEETDQDDQADQAQLDRFANTGVQVAPPPMVLPADAHSVEPPMVLPADDTMPGYSRHSDWAAYRAAEMKRDESAPKPQTSLGMRLGAALGIAAGVLASRTIAPQLFQQPAGGFSIEQMMLAGGLGVAGAVLGALLGRIIDGLRG